MIDVSKVEKRGIIIQESGVKGLKKASPSDVSGNLWPDGIVYYTFDENICKLDVYEVKLITKSLFIHIDPEYRSTFAQAIDILQAKTCLEFQNLDLIDNNETSYLNFTDTFG